ncbi:uncharacterized protein [Eucyclogobius newberryi]|uniref:uncharacterized protein n=1 Tax=Eucyclogobius newberryi TaxID=166745 RepID=UPI003B5B7669
MDYSILKGLLIAFLIQHCTSEDLTSSIQSSDVSLHDESQPLSREQEPVSAEVVPVVAPPSLQEVQKAVQEASEKEGQGAEEVLKELLERVVEAALGAAESASEPKVEDPVAVTVEGVEIGEEGQTGQTEEGQLVEDTGAGQEVVDAFEDGAVVVESNSQTIIADSTEQEPHEEVADIANNMEQAIDVTVDKESAAEMVVGVEPVQEVIADISPDLANMEQELVVKKAELVIDTAQNIAGEALEQALDTNRLLDNEMHTGAVEGNLVVQDTEQVSVEVEEMGDGETVIEAGSIVPKAAEGSEEREEEAASEAANNSEDQDQEVQQVSDGESQDGAGGVQDESLVQQSPEQLPGIPHPSPARTGAEEGASTPGDERANHDNEILAPSNDQEQVKPTLDNSVDVLVLPPKLVSEQLVTMIDHLEDATRNGEPSELRLEAWKIGAICAAVILVLETVVIIIYILRNQNKNRSGQQRACEEGVEPDATTGGDYNDDTLPAGNGDAQQTRILDTSKVASTLLQNKDEQEMEQVIPMSELLPSSADDRPNTGEPEPSPDRRTSAL